MWNQLVEIFKGEDPLQGLADQFMQLLGHARSMIETVQPFVAGRTLDEATWRELLATDAQINELEQAIRRGLVAHLSLGGSHALYCLKLMSLVKDGERLGEYAKNIARVARESAGAGASGETAERFDALEKLVLELFRDTPRLLADQGDTAALVAKGEQAEALCDALGEAALAGEGLSPAQASSSALLAFYYRRSVNHLLNILSSVGGTVDDLDRHDERYC